MSSGAIKANSVEQSFPFEGQAKGILCAFIAERISAMTEPQSTARSASLPGACLIWGVAPRHLCIKNSDHVTLTPLVCPRLLAMQEDLLRGVRDWTFSGGRQQDQQIVIDVRGTK